MCREKHRTDTVCIFLCWFGVWRSSLSEICRANRHLENNYRRNHTQFLHWNGQSLTVFYRSFPKRWISNKLHAITPVLQNWIQVKRYSLDWDSVWWIHCPIKMAIDHFPLLYTILHGVGLLVMTTVTLKIKYDPTMHVGVKKLHAH